MAGIRIVRPGGGRPRTRPERVRAAQGVSDSRHLRRHGVVCTTPDRERTIGPTRNHQPRRT